MRFSPVQLSYIGEDLDATPIRTWVPNALSLVQAVGGPIIVSQGLNNLPAGFGLTFAFLQ